MVAKFGPAISRQPRGDVIAKGFSDLVGLLPFHQPERYLGGRFRRNYRFRALAGVAPDDAINVAGRTRRDLLDQQAAFFASGDRKTDRFEKRLWREDEITPTRHDRG